MDDVQKRLQNAADNCIKAHKEWSENQKDTKAREHLMEYVHELRKVAARLEIELAISEREQMVNKPIPIPSHRSNPRNNRNNRNNDRNSSASQDSGVSDDAYQGDDSASVKVENKPTRRASSNNKEE